MRGRVDDRIQCRLCGRYLKMVDWNHLVRIHGLDPLTAVSEYKRRFGLKTTRCADLENRRLKSYLRGVERSGKRWTRRRVRREIRRYAVDGRLHPVDSLHYRTLQAVARHVFGSWDAALHACGVEQDKAPATDWTKAEVIRRILRRRRRGLSVKFNEVRRDEPALYRMAYEVTGKSWNGLLQDLGLHGRNHHWTKSSVTKQIRRWRRFGKPEPGITYDALRLAARRHFGSWTRALTAVER